MESATVEWRAEEVSVGGGSIPVERAGSGAPLVVLPRDNGHPPRSAFLDQLAKDFAVYYPYLPGFHGTEVPAWTWLGNVRDLAVLQVQLLDRLGLERATLLGLGFGGWVAAEMATMIGDRLEQLVLVGPMGIKPEREFIFDQFIVSTAMYAQTAFSDPALFEDLYGADPSFEQLESWETDREMTSRVAWKPYMYNPSLPRLLSGVRSPALIVAGENDRIVPASCRDQYRDALPNARLEIVSGGGHAVELEQPSRVAELVASFCRVPVGQA